ncbi:ribosomal protein L7/L12 [Dactylosporangium sp. NPDC051485]|uniref:ribosomal protein L7/L12 n=1 Tax=Dactylosporangium sp. NPDC051485 TaxID=3154846 RepID=UPI00342736DF
MEFIVPVLFLVVLIGLLITSGGRGAAERQRLARIAVIERKLDLIMDSLGIAEPTPLAPPGVLEELVAGRKLQAIKAYREATGVGLKEAKDAVEAIARLRGL